MAGPWEKYGQQGAAPVQAPVQQNPVIAPPDPYKQAAEQRAQEDQAREAERLRLSQEANARAEQEAQRQQAQFAGTGGKPTEYQAKSAGFLGRMIEADRMFGNVPEGSRDARTVPGQMFHDYAPNVENNFNTADRQKADQAARNFIAASLRQESGAAISASEFDNQYRIFFPMPGDSEEVIRQKAEARRQAIQGFRISAGPLADQVAAGQQPDQANPTVLGAAVGSQIGAELPGQTGGDAPPGGGQLPAMNLAQQAAYDAFFAANPHATAEQLQAFGASIGKQFPNAQEVIDYRNKYGDVAPGSAATRGSPVTDAIVEGADQLGQGAIGVAQGVTGALGLGAQLATMPQQLGTQAIWRGSGAALNALGFPNAANTVEAVGRGGQAAFDNMTDVSGMIGRANPTPQGYEASRFAGQLAGGLLLPGPKRVPANALRAAEDVGVNALARFGNRATAGEARALQAEQRIPIMTSDVRPPQTYMGKFAQTVTENIPIAGTGGLRATQQEARQQAVREVLQDYGGLAEPAAIDAVAADLSAQRGAALTRWTNVKNEIKARLPGTVPVTRVLGAIDQQIARLETLRTDAAKAVIGKLQNWRQALEGQGIDNIEAIRQEMGAAFTSPDLTHAKDLGEKVVNSLYNPLREDIGAFVESAAGPEAAAQWTRANNTLSRMAGEMKMGRLRRVLQSGDTTPEDVGNLLFSSKPSEVKALYNGLSEAGRANARAAIMQRVFRDLGSEADEVSPDRFLSIMKKVATPAGVVFRGADELRVKGLVRALQLTRRAAAASAAPPTGKMNMPFFMGMFASTGAGIPALATLGVGARIYESAPVRDLLLRLSRATPGSAQEGATFTKLQDAIGRMTPATASTIGKAANDVLAQSPGRLAARENENN